MNPSRRLGGLWKIGSIDDPELLPVLLSLQILHDSGTQLLIQKRLVILLHIFIIPDENSQGLLTRRRPLDPSLVFPYLGGESALTLLECSDLSLSLISLPIQLTEIRVLRFHPTRLPLLCHQVVSD